MGNYSISAQQGYVISFFFSILGEQETVQKTVDASTVNQRNYANEDASQLEWNCSCWLWYQSKRNLTDKYFKN